MTPKTAYKPTIAVDIDDVLAAFAKGFTDYSNRKWGTSLVPDDYSEHWAVLWQVDEAESKKRSELIHANSPEIISTLDHNPEAEEVLIKLAKNYKLVIITSRRRVLQKDTVDWLDKYFKDIFDEIHFAGIWDNLEKPIGERLKGTKTEVTRQIGADYLVDDQPKHCFAAAEAGITAILFGDYRWNRDVKLPKNVVRAKTWQEVLEYFENEKGR